jgi:hypothetical protein
LTPLILAACGGGGGSSSSANLTGQFIDAPVEGLYFVSSTGVTGTTDASGTFQFKAGDTVTFKIGGADGLELAAVKPSPAANAQIKVAELPAYKQIAQVLQTFGCPPDQDCSESKLDLRGITFNADQKTALKAHFDTEGDPTAFASNPVFVTMVKDVGTAAGKTFIAKNEAQVLEHLAKADLKFPTTSFPSFNHALLVEKDGKLSLIGINKTNNTAGFFGSDLANGIGTFKQTSGALIEITWKTIEGWRDENPTPLASGCTTSFEFKSMLKDDSLFPYGFSTDFKTSAQCDIDGTGQADTSTGAKVIPIDDSFLLADLVGKRISIKGAKNFSGEICDEEIAFDITKSNVVGELKISAAPLVGAHPCANENGNLNNYNLEIGDSLGDILSISELNPSVGTFVTTSAGKNYIESALGSDAKDAVELTWIFKTKAAIGLTPKLVLVYGGNVEFGPAPNYTASLRYGGSEFLIQSVHTVEYTITPTPLPVQSSSF